MKRFSLIWLSVIRGGACRLLDRRRSTTSSSATARSTTAPARRAKSGTSPSTATASPRCGDLSAERGRAGGRRHRPRRRARLHQHAEPLRDVADRGRPLAGRAAAGRHAGGVRRELDGAADRADEERPDGAPGRHQVRHHVDDARRVSGSPGGARHLDQRRVVRQRRDGARATRSDSTTARRPRRSSTGCARTCARRWTKARWA